MFEKKFKMLMLMLGLIVITGCTHASDLKLLKENTFTVKSGELLKTEAASGDVKVTAWDKSEVNVKIYGNQKAEEEVEFVVEKTDEGVFVKAKKDGNWGNWFSSKNIRIRIEVMVPKSFDLNVSTAGGDVYHSGVSGKLKLSTAGGDIKVNSGSGELRASTAGGDIKINTFMGNCKLSTAGGDITSEKIKGEVDASTAGGDIKLEVADGKVESSTAGGDIRIDYFGVYYGIKASTSGGDIAVRVPKDIKADLYASTFSGDIDCDFDVNVTKKYSNSKVDGKVNGGGETLKCTTTGGDIKIASR